MKQLDSYEGVGEPRFDARKVKFRASALNHVTILPH